MANWEKVGKDVEGGTWGLGKWIVISIVFLFILGGVLNAVGLIGGTAVERIVFEQSFQYKAGQAAKGAMLEAQIVEMNTLIQQNPADRTRLEGQKRVFEVQLRAITINN